eukprot:10414-Heterococcus_DN1.PRE.2
MTTILRHNSCDSTWPVGLLAGQYQLLLCVRPYDIIEDMLVCADVHVSLPTSRNFTYSRSLLLMTVYLAHMAQCHLTRLCSRGNRNYQYCSLRHCPGGNDPETSTFNETLASSYPANKCPGSVRVSLATLMLPVAPSETTATMWTRYEQTDTTSAATATTTGTGAACSNSVAPRTVVIATLRQLRAAVVAMDAIW